MTVLARTESRFLFFRNNVDKSAQISVPILIDSLGQNKFTNQWRIVEEGWKKEEMEEEIYNVLNNAVQHVIFFYKGFLSLALTISLSSLLV